MKNILETLINASEKAACVARSCCAGSKNEVLLVAEKFDGDANARFERDFKTIADVLAQEAAKTEIARHFPELADHVRGEECSEIGGVRIELRENIEGTTDLLQYLVAPAIAKRMAEAAHRDTEHTFCDNLPNIPEIDTSDVGIWIDPIDATAEFIAGVQGRADADRGLPCVTVLIGAYLRSTGEPIVGVINQPFYNNGKGRVVWGLNYQESRETGGNDIPDTNESNIILISSAEKPEVAEKFKQAGWEVKSAPGAGHKLLKVAIGEATAYIMSQGTTFRWDTCAPHSILRAKGGDLISFSTKSPITYNDEMHMEPQHYSNKDGIIAFTDVATLEKIKKILEN
ncbi:inositol polyphosphate 1-phosphatase [Spodoptera frugiperda]|uniref:Inositol polyphosphate 1-phosphatase n=1 Tax=Spodoptera frugiperda TaxID=7108 RepID=A0A9R0EJS4_SPOFR|nr:inositol polyphosphate 1-phosphatase [Spodoptera frugiperda]